MQITRPKLRPLFGFCLISILAVLCSFQLSCTPPVDTSLPTPLQVSFIDVGQGDAIAVSCDGGILLIDTGPATGAESLLKTLKNLGFTRFDKLVITHPHEDHIGGLTRVLKSFAIGDVFMPAAFSATGTFTDILTAIRNKGLTINHPTPGSSFTVGTAVCTVLAPNSAAYDALNNYSLVIRLVYANTSLLFAGDAQAESEQEILNQGFTVRSDILKVSHHGSTDATSVAFLKAVAPRYAVISAGQDNDYGHPHTGTLAKLNTADVRTYRTDRNGTITMLSDGSNITIRTEK
jgi:competence protein ComEC